MSSLRAYQRISTLLVFLTSPLAAQRNASFEVGAFAQATYFDGTLNFHQGSGGGGARLGFFVTPALEIEAEGTFVPTTGPGGLDVNYFPLRGRLLLNIPAGEHGSLLLGGGYVHSEYRDDLDASDDGATGYLGTRLGIPGLPTIRLGTYLDYIPSPQNGAGENWNWGIQAGLSFLTGVDRAEPRVEQPAEVDSVALARQDSLERAARADSLARARADSLRAQALRDSVRLEEDRRQARAQALNDSLAVAAREDSVRAVALRDSLRITRDRARSAELRDSLERVAVRDSLRALVLTRGATVIVANFELNEATLLPVSRANLQEAARALAVDPEITVEVAGHTDTTGPREFNERLAVQRAEVVKEFLIQNGVAAERMTTRGYAWDQPVASNATAPGRAQNRRTELRRRD
jgi:outer membrane protein OmpA-like peptidoglycan-associated protein